jgi:hypothetical protein
VTAAASFNGGRSQIGLNPLQTGGEYPFLNVVKTCQNWAYSSAPNKDANLDPALLDSDGFPTSIQAGGYYAVAYVPASWVGQSLTVQWDGGGTIKVPGTSPVGSTTSSNGSTNNSITCTCADQRILVGATATNAAPNNVKNIRVSLTGSETTALNAGDVFRPAYKDKLLEAGFGVLRFMDWTNNNVTNVTTWAMRKPLSYYSYYASEFRNTVSTGRPALYCGSTSSSTNTYSITGNGDGVPSSGAPAHMQVMQIKFDKNAYATVSAAVSSGANTVLTIGTTIVDAVFANGLSIIVNGVTGAWAGLNGTWTAASVSSGSVTVAFDSSALTPGGLAGTVLLFHSANSLNLNGTGAKTIKAWWANATSIGSNSYPLAQYFSTDTYGTLIYDAELDSGSGAWMLYGANQAVGSQGISSGVPPELCLQLAAEIGAHPWFVIPRFACEAGTDYMSSLAAYCRDNAPSWMIPRFETPNETFNTGNAGFHNGVYGVNKATAKWSSADQKKSHGYWASIIGQAVASAYGVAQADVKTQTLYQMINGVQTFGSTSAYNEHATSAAYIAGAVAAPAGFSKAVGVAEAWRWCTHICVAQYWTASHYGSSRETDAVTAYQSADAVTQATLLNSYADSSLNSTSGGSAFYLGPVIAQYALWKTWAQSFSINKICGYEGGYSPDYTGSSSSNLNIFRHNVKGTERIALYLQAIYQAFLDLNDNTFTAEFPSNFMLTDFTYGTTTTYAWTLLKGDLESANTPMFDFIVRFNKGRRAISPRLRIHG